MVLRLETIVYPPAKLGSNNVTLRQAGSSVSNAIRIDCNGQNGGQAPSTAVIAQPAGLLFCLDHPETVILGAFAGMIKTKWMKMRPESK